jgi:hypothetical protein
MISLKIINYFTLTAPCIKYIILNMKLEEICIDWFAVMLHIGQCRPVELLKLRQLRKGVGIV